MVSGTRSICNIVHICRLRFKHLHFWSTGWPQFDNSFRLPEKTLQTTEKCQLVSAEVAIVLMMGVDMIEVCQLTWYVGVT